MNDLEVVMSNIDLTNSMIDSTIEDRSNMEICAEMIVTLDALNQKMNKLVEQLTDKNEENLFNSVLLIVEDINQTRNRFNVLSSNKRPQPFISAYKNAVKPEEEEEHYQPATKKPAPKKFDDEEEEDVSGQAYNQFQFNDEEDEDDAKDNRDFHRGAQPPKPQAPLPQHQPAREPPKQASSGGQKGGFFDQTDDFFGPKQTPQPQPNQTQPPAQRVPEKQSKPVPPANQTPAPEPEVDLLGSDAPKKPAVQAGTDLLDLSTPIPQPTATPLMPMNPYAGGYGMQAQPGFPGMNPMYAGAPGMMPAYGVNPAMRMMPGMGPGYPPQAAPQVPVLGSSQ